jgi:hypothetical protein
MKLKTYKKARYSKNKKHIKNKTHKRKNSKTFFQKGHGRGERERERNRLERLEKEQMEIKREYVRAQQNIKQRFRNTFINLFNKIKSAVESNNKDKINNVIVNFYDSFSSNRSGINTLIPVNNNNYPINKIPSLNSDNFEEDKLIYNFVPLLVVIYQNINDVKVKKEITRIYKQNMGNINLESSRLHITALSFAVMNRDKELVNFLLENDADKNTLSDEQKLILADLLVKPAPKKKAQESRKKAPEQLTSIIGMKMDYNEEAKEVNESKEIMEIKEEPEKIVNPQIVNAPVKLILSAEPPSEYNPNIEPEFWKPIFQENEMTSLRQIITEMINRDINIPLIKKSPDSSYKQVETMWSVCQINKTLIPTYYVNTINESYESFRMFIMDIEPDFINYNIILCAALIIFGIVTYKMKDQDYNFVIKGGKAIQLVLSDIQDSDVYKTEDIDILIVPKDYIAYNENTVKNLAANLAHLTRWFLSGNVNNFNISIQSPDPNKPTINQYIYKLSYVKIKKKQMFNRVGNNMIEVNDYKPFSDIDFKSMKEPVATFFKDVINYTFYVPELNTSILFTCPSINAILDEKLYYYAKYTVFLHYLKTKQPITEVGYTTLGLSECYMILDKFKRAILSINKGIVRKSQLGEINETTLKASIASRFEKLQITNPQLQQDIISGLYSEV